MIKKISALVLALVLCLSVVVMPASALESGKSAGYRLEIDPSGYTAGSKVTVKLYIEFAANKEVAGCPVIFGVNDVFVESQAASATDTAIIASAEYNEAFTSFFKVGADATWSWNIPANLANTIKSNSTEATYEKLLKFTPARNTSGTNENVGNTKRGIATSILNADTEPLVTFQLTLAQDIKEGSEIVIGVASGALNGSAAYIGYLSNPGSSTATTKPKAADCDLTEALFVAEGSILTPLKGQMRYNLDDKSKFDVRALAVISGEDFATKFTDEATAKDMIKEAGFVFAAGSNVDKPSIDAVKALVENGTPATGYKKATVDYISTSISSGNYAFSCLVEGISDADAQTNSLVAVGYIAWDSNADGTVDSYAYYPAAQTIEFAKLYANKK